MFIKKLSKCRYSINGKIFDTRKQRSRHKYHGIRGALQLYFQDKNPNVKWYVIDKRVCNFINRNLQFFNAIDGIYAEVNTDE